MITGEWEEEALAGHFARIVEYEHCRRVYVCVLYLLVYLCAQSVVQI